MIKWKHTFNKDNRSIKKHYLIRCHKKNNYYKIANDQTLPNGESEFMYE